MDFIVSCLTTITLLYVELVQPQTPPSGKVEYCMTEQLKASCGHDSVIDIQSAMYGRMHIGRCVSTDYGHLGCEADVRTMTDRRCSGRHECRIDIPDRDFERTKPCPVEFIKFFEVEYKCVKVITGSPHSCRDDDAMTLTAREGHISSLITEERGVGSVMCPWKISLNPGQRINITLYDFGIPTDQELEKIGQHDSSLCFQYALLTERRSSGTRSTRICSGTERIRHVYLSRGSHMEVRIVPKKNQDVSSQFLLKYEALGCSFPEPPAWGRLEQDDWDFNTVTVHCNHSEASWKLVCNGNKWTAEGTVAKCPKDASDDSNMITWGNIKLPYGLSVGIIVGLAVIIGVIILLVGLICMEWRKMRNASQMAVDLPPHESLYKDTSLYNKHQMGYQNRPPPPGGATCRELRDNDYSYVKEMWPAAATPTGGHDPRIEPIYQVQNIRNSPTPGASAHGATSHGDPLSNPYGIEYFGPNTNPYGIKLGPQHKVKKPSLVGEATGSMDSDEGQHIYESPDGIRGYNTMNTQHSELDNKNAPKHSTPPKTANVRATQRI